MLKVEPNPERERLGFKDAVLSSFKFLRDLGLRPVEKKMTLVRYKSRHVFVDVYHGRASFELGVEIGRLADPKKTLSIATIVDWAGAYKAEGFGQHVMFQVTTREGVQEFVPKLAALVKKYAIRLLRNDDSAWDAALNLQRRQWDEYVKEVHLGHVREKAEAAWHAKDYIRVVELYEPVRQDLTEIEAKKLAYAEHQILTAEGAGSRSSSRGGR
ncbi:MAG: hypothetical protein ACRD8A_04120 [Candidatus Acidiferrales bacterium]